MELARDYCNKEGLHYEASFYDIKRNHCYAIGQVIDSISIIRHLVDVQTGMVLAWTRYYFGLGHTNFGQIGETRVPFEKAEAYINKFIKRMDEQ
jgi:hypothetical protein